MPTRSKPQLTEGPSVWGEPSLERGLRERKEIVLCKLGFYWSHDKHPEHHHDRPEDFEGKFKERAEAHENGVLSEIVGALTLAGSALAWISRPVLIATLEKIRKNPELIHREDFPGEVLGVLARAYQRENEKTGTYWPDIMGEAPENFNGRLEQPSSENIRAAAFRAILLIKEARRSGRQHNIVNERLGEKLGELFRRYNSKITRHSVQSARDGYPYQIESGAFCDFVKVALGPLQAYLREHGLPEVSVSGIVRHAMRIQAELKPPGTLLIP